MPMLGSMRAGRFIFAMGGLSRAGTGETASGGGSGMRITRTFITAMRALRRNVMRAVLTTLGIVIGVGAVIAMMQIGHGSSTAIQRTVAAMGADNILIFPGAA